MIKVFLKTKLKCPSDCVNHVIVHNVHYFGSQAKNCKPFFLLKLGLYKHEELIWRKKEPNTNSTASSHCKQMYDAKSLTPIRSNTETEQ